MVLEELKAKIKEEEEDVRTCTHVAIDSLVQIDNIIDRQANVHFNYTNNLKSHRRLNWYQIMRYAHLYDDNGMPTE